MSATEFDEYIRGIKWKSGISILASTITTSILIAGLYYGLKIELANTKSDLMAFVVKEVTVLNRKQDSTQFQNTLQFHDIWNELGRKPNKVIYYRSTSPAVQLPPPAYREFNQRIVNGRTIWVPAK